MPTLSLMPIVSPRQVSVLQRTEGGSISMSMRVGRNVISGVQRINTPRGLDAGEYILQETGFQIDLEDGSGGILTEN